MDYQIKMQIIFNILLGYDFHINRYTLVNDGYAVCNFGVLDIV